MLAVAAAIFTFANGDNVAFAHETEESSVDSVALIDGSGRFDVWIDVDRGASAARLYFGDTGDTPLMGDWNCDGIDTPGVYRGATGRVYLRDSLSSGPATRSYSFGLPGDIALAGDFDGDGCDTVSVYRPSQGRAFISNSLHGFLATSFYFGNPGDRPFVGDFDGDGDDTLGLHRESTGLVYFRNSLSAGVANWAFMYGNPGDRIVAGDWDGDGVDTVAVYRPSNGVLYIKNANQTGVADVAYTVGSYKYVAPVSGIPSSIANSELSPNPPETSTPPETTTPPATPTPSTGAVYSPDVHVYPGDDLAELAYEYPEGTVFMIHGVISGQSVEPKDGQIFFGTGDAVLDGEGWEQFAFSGSASNVVIQGLVIRNYATPAQYGTVYVSGSGWLIEDNEITGSAGAGLSVRDGDFVAENNVIRNNWIHHNSQLGMAVTGTDGTVLDGNEIAYNNWQDEYNWGWEAGATKFWETANLVVRGNWVHDNNGPGLWADTDNTNTVYEGNVIEDNYGPGIFHEVSGGAVIRNNVIRRNGFDWQAWLWGSGILIAASDNVDIYGNVLDGNYNGITLVQQDREHGHVVADVSVRDNTLINTGLSGAATDTGDDSIFSSANNWFENNTYIGDVGWAWDGITGIDWYTWQDSGNDADGSYQPE